MEEARAGNRGREEAREQRARESREAGAGTIPGIRIIIPLPSHTVVMPYNLVLDSFYGEVVPS